jgi:hypothetical protein
LPSEGLPGRRDLINASISTPFDRPSVGPECHRQTARFAAGRLNIATYTKRPNLFRFGTAQESGRTVFPPL